MVDEARIRITIDPSRARRQLEDLERRGIQPRTTSQLRRQVVGREADRERVAGARRDGGRRGALGQLGGPAVALSALARPQQFASRFAAIARGAFAIAKPIAVAESIRILVPRVEGALKELGIPVEILQGLTGRIVDLEQNARSSLIASLGGVAETTSALSDLARLGIQPRGQEVLKIAGENILTKQRQERVGLEFSEALAFQSGQRFPQVALGSLKLMGGLVLQALRDATGLDFDGMLKGKIQKTEGFDKKIRELEDRALRGGGRAG